MRRLAVLTIITVLLGGWTHGSTGTLLSPGPNAVLFANPYYVCTTNKYISTTGSDSANGSLATPWLTLAHADSTTPTAGTCINVEPGTYAAGLTVTHGGNLASSTGYVVYRCTTFLGCTITDAGTNAFNAAFGVQANYVMFDGFVVNGGAGTGVNTLGFGTCNSSSPPCSGNNTIGYHHIWVLNSNISGYGQAGIEFADGDYFYVVHDTISNNSHDCQAAQGSGLSYFLPILLSPYTPTAGDGNNSVTGNTGSLFRMFVTYTVFFNNYIGCASPPVTDGNGIIMDDWQGDQFATPTGNPMYIGGGLVDHNVVYNNGGGGIHVFASLGVTVTNNSVFNNYVDTVSTNQGFRGNIDDAASYGGTYLNNISVAIAAGSGILQNNSAVGIYGIDGGSNYVASTTLSAAITTTGQTSISVTSNAQFPGGSTFTTTAPSGGGNAKMVQLPYTLPGGNTIKIDNEIMWVTAGWGTNTWTVTRGYNATTAATHSNGATIEWIQNYYSNNITHVTAGAFNEIDDGQGSAANAYYSSTANTLATLPSWVNVGNSSNGSESAPPVGANFALQAGSPAINTGTIAAPFNFLPSSAVDAGACAHALATCP